MLLKSCSGIWLVGVSERPIQAVRIGDEEDAKEDAAAVDEGRMSVESLNACNTRRLCACGECWRRRVVCSGYAFFFHARAHARHSRAEYRVLVNVQVGMVRHRGRWVGMYR